MKSWGEIMNVRERGNSQGGVVEIAHALVSCQCHRLCLPSYAEATVFVDGSPNSSVTNSCWRQRCSEAAVLFTSCSWELSESAIRILCGILDHPICHNRMLYQSYVYTLNTMCPSNPIVCTMGYGQDYNSTLPTVPRNTLNTMCPSNPFVPWDMDRTTIVHYQQYHQIPLILCVRPIPLYHGIQDYNSTLPTVPPNTLNTTVCVHPIQLYNGTLYTLNTNCIWWLYFAYMGSCIYM